jgi:hypothetical protein
VITLGSAAALAVGLFSGLTGIQSAYAAILLGWVVGRAIRRSRSDTPTVAGAGIIALTGSATVTVIALMVRIMTVAYVPLQLADLPPQGPERTWEILLSPACNLMDHLAHLFSVRSCWHGCQRCQQKSWRWGERWSGEFSGGVRRVREGHVPAAAAHGVPSVR